MSTTSRRIRVKRVYEPAAKSDGERILVDRLWPRGMSKAEASWDEWRKDLAPTTALRRWYGHDPDRSLEFARRYEAELREPAARAAIRDLVRHGRGAITLLTATHDVERSAATVLVRIMRRLARSRAT